MFLKPIIHLMWANREFQTSWLFKAPCCHNSTVTMGREMWHISTWLLKCLLGSHWPEQVIWPSLTSKKIGKLSYTPYPWRCSQKYVVSSTNDLNSFINDIHEMMCWRPHWWPIRERVSFTPNDLLQFLQLVCIRKRNTLTSRKVFRGVYHLHLVLSSAVILISNGREESDSQKKTGLSLTKSSGIGLSNKHISVGMNILLCTDDSYGI